MSQRKGTKRKKEIGFGGLNFELKTTALKTAPFFTHPTSNLADRSPITNDFHLPADIFHSWPSRLTPMGSRFVFPSISINSTDRTTFSSVDDASRPTIRYPASLSVFCFIAA